LGKEDTLMNTELEELFEIARQIETAGTNTGFMIGKLTGWTDSKLETIYLMFADGQSAEQIVKYTGLSSESIRKTLADLEVIPEKTFPPLDGMKYPHDADRIRKAQKSIQRKRRAQKKRGEAFR
jgi:hypothetical protein